MSLGLISACQISETNKDANTETDKEVGQTPTEPSKLTPLPLSALSLADALGHKDRPEDDLPKDKIYKTEIMVDFMGIPPKAVILELQAEDGYFTEIFSHMVGGEGLVIMQNPQNYDGFVPPNAIDARLGTGGQRLPNVTSITANFDRLPLPDNSVHMIIWIDGPHDLYFKPTTITSFGNPSASFDQIFRVLAPGGELIIVDNKAELGSQPSSGNLLHRIDPSIVQGLAERAGFTLTQTSDILSNPSDDLSISVFDVADESTLDRFIHRYTKP